MFDLEAPPASNARRWGRGRAGRRRTRGFTLPELVLTIIVVGLLAVVAVPKFFDRTPFAEQGFLDASLAAVRYAHKMALATGCDVEVEFTASGYALARRSGCTAGAFDTPVPHPTHGGDFSASAPSDVAVGPPVTFFFDKVGRPRDTSGTLLTAGTDVGIGGRTLRVEPQTGFVHEP